MAELGDEDDFPNDFDGLDFDNIPGLQAPTANGCTPEVSVLSVVPANTVPSSMASPAQSSGSGSVEDMDSTFLAVVDALEARALSEVPQGGYSTNIKNGMSVPPLSKGSLNQGHDGSMQTTESSSANRKGKRKVAEEDIDVQAILAGYESELTCPICCDLLVGAQVANPCGHTCCGECGYGWLTQNQCAPTCAVCRSSLFSRKPLLPNFAVDNFVRQHLQALAESGRPEWQERGYRTIEWNKRVESWKKQSDARAAKEKLKAARLRPRQPLYYEDDLPYVPWLTEEGMHDDTDVPAPRIMPRRGTRSRY